MVRGVWLIPLAGALCAASVASAQVSTAADAKPAPKTTAPAATAAVATGDPNRRVCKAVTTTGTRLGKAKICRTAREWAEQTDQDRRSLERMQGTRTTPTS